MGKEKTCMEIDILNEIYAVANGVKKNTVRLNALCSWRQAVRNANTKMIIITLMGNAFPESSMTADGTNSYSSPLTENLMIRF
jgi:hypothetical protein